MQAELDTKTGDQSDSEIKTAYENNADTNAFTNTEKTNLSNQSGTNTGDQDLSGKQDTLLSGTNIKTINSTSLLGSGDIVISGESSSGAQYEIQYSDGAGGFGASATLKTDASGNITAGKELILGTEGTKLREETGFGYSELKTNGQLRMHGDAYRWLTTGGVTLRLDTWSGDLQSYTVGAAQAVKWNSGITNGSAQDYGFVVNNAATTTKGIIGFQSAGVEKASIDADGNLTIAGNTGLTSEGAGIMRLTDGGAGDSDLRLGAVYSGYWLGSGDVRSYQNSGGAYVSLKTDATAAKSGLFRSNAGFFAYYDTGDGDVVLDATYSGAGVSIQNSGVERLRIPESGGIVAHDSADNTKTHTMNLSSISTGTNVTWTVGDFDINFNDWFASNGTHLKANSGYVIFDNGVTDYLYHSGTYFEFRINNVRTLYARAKALTVPSDSEFSFSSTTSASGTVDAGIVRDSAGVVKITDGGGGYGELLYHKALINISALHTAVATNHVINCTANSFTVTLPTAVGIQGKEYIIKNSGSGVITVDGTETIDGDLTQSLNQYDSLTVVSDDTKWAII